MYFLSSMTYIHKQETTVTEKVNDKPKQSNEDIINNETQSSAGLYYY